jgi:predicted dinucleotide-binding enzyme
VFGAAPAGDIVVLAVPYSAVLDVVKQYGEELAGKLLVDITNPINSDFTDFVTSVDSFGAPEIAKAAPAVADEELGGQPSSKFVPQAFTGARLVKGFNHLLAATLDQDPVEHGGKRVVFLASDDDGDPAIVVRRRSLGKFSIDIQLAILQVTCNT